jgi:hypothetical protein
MNTYHIAAIVGGLAVGLFLGYELSGKLQLVQPYRWLGIKILGYSSPPIAIE